MDTNMDPNMEPRLRPNMESDMGASMRPDMDVNMEPDMDADMGSYMDPGMDESNLMSRKGKYTMNWLLLQSLFVIGISVILAIIAKGIVNFAGGRVTGGLLKGDCYNLLSESVVYCFAVISITCVSLMLVEVAFRKGINLIQYTLVCFALTLFYLLLLAISEHIPFAAAYSIVSVMTIGLIVLFVKGITHNSKAVKLIAGILVVEYLLMFILVNLGSMALLVGSLSLFILIAGAMYCTLKLRLVNDELTLK